MGEGKGGREGDENMGREKERRGKKNEGKA